ncbi:uncharacterized protein LOC131228790 [Magnolia sinica]|uniref:uncharacterized protein LOC131228790 n=1 Tax=Magnolia sinica TaxID=86752 RepID=UPI00265998E4|nr:uncharacterized protein LOC131228790 [Magnolia sinica]
MLEEMKLSFTDDIMRSQLPPRFRMPQITPYFRAGDPTEHLESFRAWMELRSASSSVMCRAFSLTLSGEALKWYRQLKPKSIGSFTQLSKTFIMQFIGEKDKRKPTTHLLTVTQKEDELLKNYIIRFNEETVQVNNYSDQIALAPMILSLQEGKFLFSIGKNPPTILGDLLNQAQKYSNAKELFSLRNATRSVRNLAKDRKRKEESHPLSAARREGMTTRTKAHALIDNRRADSAPIPC